MTVYIGDLLTASAASVAGKPTPSRTWQWLRNGTAISGATSSNYTVVESDVDTNLSVKQIETNIAGSDDATSLTVGPVSAVAPFTPASLFASGEEGTWYDPSPTTAFTDTGGTVAATYGDPVAYLQDLSGNGNHATQTTLASRPILARVPEGGRRNLLETTETLSSSSLIGVNTPTTSTTVDTNNVITLTDNTSNLSHFSGYGPYQISGNHTVSVRASASSSYVVLYAQTDSGADRYCAIFDLSTQGVTTDTRGTPSGSNAISDLGNGYYFCSITFNANGADTYVRVGLYDGVSGFGPGNFPTFTGDGTNGVDFYGFHFEAGSTATDYQKVVNEYDITEAGVTSLEYLSFDGVDDGIATASIDFTSTDKMSVFAGVRKITDTTGLNASAIVESSAAADANNGSFFLFGRNGFAPAAQYQVGSRGTTFVLAGTNDAAFAAPVTNVVTGLGDIAGDTATLRIDGVQVAQNTSDQGAGNYLTYPLYIGRRAGSTLPFDGHIYGLIVRGASSTTDEITNTEAYLATRSGVTL